MKRLITLGLLLTNLNAIGINVKLDKEVSHIIQSPFATLMTNKTKLCNRGKSTIYAGLLEVKYKGNILGVFTTYAQSTRDAVILELDLKKIYFFKQITDNGIVPYEYIDDVHLKDFNNTRLNYTLGFSKECNITTTPSNQLIYTDCEVISKRHIQYIFNKEDNVTTTLNALHTYALMERKWRLNTRSNVYPYSTIKSRLKVFKKAFIKYSKRSTRLCVSDKPVVKKPLLKPVVTTRPVIGERYRFKAKLERTIDVGVIHNYIFISNHINYICNNDFPIIKNKGYTTITGLVNGLDTDIVYLYNCKVVSK